MNSSLPLLVACLSALLVAGCATAPGESGQRNPSPAAAGTVNLTDGTFVFKVKKVAGVRVIQSINGVSAAGYTQTPIFKIVADLINDADRLFATGLKEFGGLANLREGESTEITLRMKDGNVLM